ncbi:hypothetical protein [Sorangium sp. So ce131]|uniref:hypothetical protein n=1 Tax=Sorangium sp. So ce131 TaxID=3133282 RepID=UPI003F643BE5
MRELTCPLVDLDEQHSWVGRHCAAVALHYVYTNLCHIPRNMRITAAMAAGITDRVWTLEPFAIAAISRRTSLG